MVDWPGGGTQAGGVSALGGVSMYTLPNLDNGEIPLEALEEAHGCVDARSWTKDGCRHVTTEACFRLLLCSIHPLA